MTDTIWPPDLSGVTDAKYIVLIQSLRFAIRSGQLTAGTRMAPVRDLAWQLKITPGTVARAYKMAVDEGLLEATVGRGTFVSDGTRAEVTDETPSLISFYQSGDVQFRAVRVPNVGQDQVLRDLMIETAKEVQNNFVECPTPEMDLAAREAVVHWIGQNRVGRLKAEDVVLGLGAQHSVILALQAVIHGQNPIILTEDLGYPGVRHAGRLLRAQVVGVGMDNEGIRPDRLEDALKKSGGQVLLTSAEVHSPTTIRTSITRRGEIADIARQYNLQIIEDDCHCVTRQETPTYRSLCPERGWYVSSLTKSVSASLRFGFIVCAVGQEVAGQTAAQSSFYGLPLPLLDLCQRVIESGEAERIRAMSEIAIARRVEQAVNIMGKWDISWRRDAPFIWLRLPQGWRGSTFVLACGVEKIQLKSADEFSLSDGQAPNAVRIGLNPDLPDQEFEGALRKMSEILSRPPVIVDV